MIKLCKDWVYDYYKKKIFKFTVAYMILGVLIFTFSNFQLSYINMIYYVMGHPYLIAFFLTPVILFTTVSILSEFMANKNLIIRFNSRKELIKFEIVLSIIIILITLYCIVISVDMNRVNSFREPIFAIVKQENDLSMKTIIYQGLGYEVRMIKDVTDGKTKKVEMYMFNKCIAGSIE